MSLIVDNLFPFQKRCSQNRKSVVAHLGFTCAFLLLISVPVKWRSRTYVLYVFCWMKTESKAPHSLGVILQLIPWQAGDSDLEFQLYLLSIVLVIKETSFCMWQHSEVGDGNTPSNRSICFSLQREFAAKILILLNSFLLEKGFLALSLKHDTVM